MRPKIYQNVGFHEIRDFATLVNKCMMFDKASKARRNFYKMVNENKGKGSDRGKPYGKDKGRRILVVAPSQVGEAKCGGMGHYVNECKKDAVLY